LASGLAFLIAISVSLLMISPLGVSCILSGGTLSRAPPDYASFGEIS
jgi:hypothetical protein